MSHISNRATSLKEKNRYKLKTRNMQSVPLTTYVGQWNAKILWLKQTTDFKIHSIRTLK
jgi:hypothetical protein